METARYDYTYDDYGNRKTKTDINGIVTYYDYDVNNRLTSERYSQNSVIYETGYGYDDNGNLTVAVKNETKPFDSGVTGSVDAIFLEDDTQGRMTFYRYDGLDRLRSMQSADTEAIYTYDYKGLRKSKTVYGETITHI